MAHETARLSARSVQHELTVKPPRGLVNGPARNSPCDEAVPFNGSKSPTCILGSPASSAPTPDLQLHDRPARPREFVDKERFRAAAREGRLVEELRRSSQTARNRKYARPPTFTIRTTRFGKVREQVIDAYFERLDHRERRTNANHARYAAAEANA